jgi:hypothetical protein
VAVSNVHIHLPNHNKCMILHNACFCMLFSEKKPRNSTLFISRRGQRGKKMWTRRLFAAKQCKFKKKACEGKEKT